MRMVYVLYGMKKDYNEKQSGQGKQENKRQLNIQRRRTGSHAF